jgi:cell division protein FtsI (penicillin-binding protein 3)
MINLAPMTYRWRYRIVLLLLFLASMGLIWRVVDLTIINRTFLKKQGDARTERIVPIPAYRGMITDRNGDPLAISTPVASVWVNPQEIAASSKEIAELASLLEMTPSELKAKLKQNQNKEFVYLKRGMEPAVADQIKDLKVAGIYVQREFHRYYPEGEVTAHVLGFTNVDDKGQEGIELAYNDWLQGVSGSKKVIKDRMGRIVEEVGTVREPRPGQDLTLSIDRRIQYLAYRELADGVKKYEAISGSVVVLNVKTGEILAMVNTPSYNPNDRSSRVAAHDGRYRNRAVTDVYEPGSTIKSFSMTNALLSGRYHSNSTIDTAPGWMMIDGKKVQEDDNHNLGVIDLTTILARSSNVGIAKITLSLPPDRLWNLLHTVGFGQLTDSGFPGERAGQLVERNKWPPFALATLSFGYGMSVTTLQLAQAYNVFANQGVKRPVTFLKLDKPAAGEQVIEANVAKEILTMLESVLETGGTATEAKVPGYRVTGKTGTARVVGENGYEKHRHNSSFVGIAPASDPQLLIAVVLNDVKGSRYYGGYSAGPIFSQIMGGALQLMDIPPDNLQT